ncbi:MAG: hypothetical protein ACREVE_10005 [Gammaproteobacteria bacterium]
MGTVSRFYAVFTGDLIRSSALTKKQLDAVRRDFLTAAGAINQAGWADGKLLRGQPEFFRGDAWQMLLTDPRWALRVAIYLRAVMLGQGLADTRIAIGIGAVDSVSRTRVSLSRGEAFTRSGRALDSMSPRFRMAIAVPDESRAMGDWLSTVVALCDCIIGRWQTRQAQVAGLMSLRKSASHADIARLTKPRRISQQAVSKALGAAGWPGLELAMERFESISWQQPF